MNFNNKIREIHYLLNEGEPTDILHCQVRQRYNKISQDSTIFNFEVKIVDIVGNVYAQFAQKHRFPDVSYMKDTLRTIYLETNANIVAECVISEVKKWMIYGKSDSCFLSLLDAKQAAKVLLYNRKLCGFQ